MDEISAYLIEEIAMDGESGTDKKRFAHFIRKFHQERHTERPDEPMNTVDDLYVNSVWKVFSKQPRINIGRRVPAASGSGSAGLSKQGKGIKKLKSDFASFVDKVEILSKDRPETFQDLYSEEYGDEVRIVVDEALARLKITGSTNDKLVTGATYATLQIAARAREEAVASTEIGRLTGFDAKTVFSFLKKLIELELVVKFKVNENRTSTNYVLHRRYWNKSPRWLAIAEAEAEASAVAAGNEAVTREGSMAPDEGEDGGNITAREASPVDEPTQMPFRDNELDSDSDDGAEADSGDESRGVLPSSELQGMLSYPRMTPSRALTVASSPALLRGRLLKLMDKCKSHVVARPRLWERLGFEHGTRRERKVFNEVVRRLINLRDIEYVFVDIEGRKPLACLRLTEKGLEEARNEGAAARDAATKAKEMHLEEQLRKADFAYRAHVTFERQIVDVINSSGAAGATVTDIANRLSFSDNTRRHIDEYLRKTDEGGPDVNAQDLFIEGAKEMFGRERRIRYWTRPGIIQHYRGQAEQTVILQEQIEAFQDVNLDKLTSFNTPNDERTYSNAAELFAELSQPLEERATPSGPAGKGDSGATPKPAKVRKTPVKDPNKQRNPIDPVTGKVRKGRPRKIDQAAKRGAAEEGEGAPPKKKPKAGKSAAADPTPVSSEQLPGPSTSTTSVTQPAEADEAQRNDVAPASDEIQHLASTSAITDDSAIQLSSAVNEDHASAAPDFGDPEPVVDSANSVKMEDLSDSADQKSTPASRRAARRRNPPAKSRLNLSAERRSRLLLDLLDANGGIIDEMDFNAKFEMFVNEREGENADAYLNDVGDLREIKTRRRVYDALTSRGSVGVKTTMAPMKRGGGYAQRKIIYKTDLPAEVVDEFLQEIAAGRRTRQPNQYVARAETSRKIALGDMDAAQAEALAADHLLATKPLHELLEDSSTRAMFSQSRVIVSQQYGLIVGSIGKLSYLHKYLMRALELETEEQQGGIGVTSRKYGVIDIDAMMNHAPLEVFTKLKAPQADSPDLTTALADPLLRSKPVCEQSEAVQSSLEVSIEGSNRSYFEQLVASLYLLGLATPVEDFRPEADGIPLVAAAGLRDHPSLYRFKLDERLMVALRKEADPGPAEMRSLADANTFWHNLFRQKDVCCREMSHTLRHYHQHTSLPEWVKAPLSLLTYRLGKSSSWNTGYQLSKRQSNFILRFIDYPEGALRGSILDDPGMLEQLSSITMAPTWVIEQRIRKALGPAPKKSSVKHSKPSSKRARPSKQKEDDSSDSAPEDTSAAIHAYGGSEAERRAAQLRRARAIEWIKNFEEMCQTHNIDGMRHMMLEEATRQLKGQFLDTGDAFLLQMLSAMVEEALRPPPADDSIDAAGEGASVQNDRPGRDRQSSPEGVQNPDLLGRKRRNKIAWTRESDELLRDAGMILTVRDAFRNNRSNWAVAKALFPDKSPIQIRKRFVEVLSQAVGDAAYLTQLGVEWQKLWELYRGTSILPDRDPRKADGFDLRVHVDFLRQHIDKEEVQRTVELAATTANLTLALEDFGGQWILKETRALPPAAVHNPDQQITQVNRTEALVSHTFTVPNGTPEGGADEDADMVDEDLMFERQLCAVKMSIDTPSHLWNEAAAVDFVMGVGERQIGEACKAMLDERCIRLASSEGRRLPGRNFTYTDDFVKRRQNLPVPVADLASQSIAAQRSLTQQLEDEDEVELLMDDEVGNTVATVQLLHNGTVESLIDLEQLQLLKNETKFNCKALIDQDVEVGIKLIKIAGGDTNGRSETTDLTKSLALEAPPRPERLSPADWLPYSETMPRLRDAAFESVAKGARGKRDSATADSIQQFKVALDSAGKVGIPLSQVQIDGSILGKLLQQSSRTSPMAFLAGYDCPRIISALYLKDWAVKLALKDTWVMPRCWVAMEGQFIEQRWREGVEQIIGHLFVYCGATRARLCELLSPQWDRLEVCDLIRGACSTGVVEQRFICLSSGETFTGLDAEYRAKTDEEIFVAPTRAREGRSGRPWYGFVMEESFE
ncbi:hypothetical protein BCV69DRAFT_312424 [Microstroma glucosiphilum]|uniref:Uncharacterized protein n=1 Tax=Pseudomicrostroma glucosiphilum TaxID=1684307 RepID=A0A316U9L1_9BASI|nr:hypothetical protein BCV69DRAFT_312424 [Pseudomicrostroma glucosiphilum]PWN21171.1 hypothetical protein BCV69DRAFT_312424 [Pseudomicrostroma glucosiphilum]